MVDTYNDSLSNNHELLCEMDRLKALYEAMNCPMPLSLLTAASDARSRIQHSYLTTVPHTSAPATDDEGVEPFPHLGEVRQALPLVPDVPTAPSSPAFSMPSLTDSFTDESQDIQALNHRIQSLEATLAVHVIKAYTCGHCQQYNAPANRQRWYAIIVGREVGVFDDGNRAEKATEGVTGNKYYSFGCHDLALDKYREHLHAGEVEIVTSGQRVKINAPKYSPYNA
ncbi:hypothetical protein C8J56DRAFT_890956 [Mycena floridula]|nr:hypothetical protein C8J56DRAFT_890956 [Mycena floridula]